MFARLYHYLVMRPYWIALLITGILICWMLLKPAHDPSTEVQSAENNEKLPKVQTSRFTPRQITKYLTLYGRSEANSSAVIRAEVAGEIELIAAKKRPPCKGACKYCKY